MRNTFGVFVLSIAYIVEPKLKTPMLQLRHNFGGKINNLFD